ncbi:family 43 glycosylhydrolase [candidate division WOR-3 bacterium]|nr:family 43 glycosylhydrolase [candidate division WOR-3 bacterium]
MKRLLILLSFYFIMVNYGYGQSPSFQTYMNPIIPGDHPDPTLTKIGENFYTSGSSFNPTPKIYRSTDLVHWEVIAQPVKASWSQYGDGPGDGIWGGHMVLYNGTYWHYFGGHDTGRMYFVTATQPEGPWSEPTVVNIPAGMSGLGIDNSIFIDDETDKWYLLTKNGHVNNHMVELGEDGQPTGVVLDLTWLNADTTYGWAEGPVMWKHKDFYYYSFAEHLYGKQYVMRSDTLTDDESDWTIVGNNIFTGSQGTFGRPNHISPVVMLDDSTSWTIVHSYHNDSRWYAHGRQGLLCQVTYNEEDFPVIQYPPSYAVTSPALPGSGIPWMVPKSDMFDESELHPRWSFLGYKPDGYYSLTEREGWLYLEPYNGENTVIQNDGEHNYSLITKVDFEPESASDEAGLWIINGPETHYVKVFSTVNSESENVLVFSFEDISYEVENTIGSTVWLKLLRNNHTIYGYYSSDGFTWTRIGKGINAGDLDIEQTSFNDFTGSQQGLYVEGKPAFFDLYIYRDAYTEILAECPANQYGTSRKNTSQGYVLSNIHADDWAMYAGVEFGGNADYPKAPDSFAVIASSATSGGIVEVWLDSIDTGNKVAECNIESTGDWENFEVFTSEVDSVSGRHDVYLKFTGEGTGELFLIQWLKFLIEGDSLAFIEETAPSQIPKNFILEQNYPNPFALSTNIRFGVPENSFVSLKVYNLLGQEVAVIAEREFSAGRHSVMFDASHLAAGMYFYRLTAGSFTDTKKLLFVK